jgi:hypothetical protein
LQIEVPVKIELRGFGSKLDSPEEQTNKRMEFFIKKILPESFSFII